MNIIYTVIFMILLGCSGDSNKKEQNDDTQLATHIPQNEPSNLAIPDNRFSNTYNVLLFGNSHVSGLSNLITTLIITGNPFAKVSSVSAAGGFLDNDDSFQDRINRLESENWTHIILQGQKYSQSGNFDYPTTSAQSWIQKAKALNITPILFPEHPQRGKTTEGERVHRIHIGISERQSSCVAPIGLTWDKVIATAPQLSLHTSDGNHAALMGNLLTAYVFYEVITGQAADLLPFIESIDVEESTQALLKQLASETIKANIPCKFAI